MNQMITETTPSMSANHKRLSEPQLSQKAPHSVHDQTPHFVLENSSRFYRGTTLKGIRLLVVSLILSNCFSQLRAQNNYDPVASSSTEQAIARSQERLLEAQSLMKSAMDKRSQHNLEAAYQDAVNALSMTPSGEAIVKDRQVLVSEYTRIALDYSRELIQNGRYQDAENVAKTVLDREVNPGNKEAVKLLSDLEQPSVFNKTVTPKSAAQRDQVVKLLSDANGYTQSGRYGLAMQQYDAVLLIDPYNTAARKGMEAIHQATAQYADAAYNETRSRMLWQVEKAWERPPQKPKHGRSTESVGRGENLRGTDEIVARLNTIIIPKIDLNDTPISEAVEYLKQKSKEQDPLQKGVNIFLKLNDQNAAIPAPSAAPQPVVAGATPSTPPSTGLDTIQTEPHVSLSLSHVPLIVALDYVSKLANLKLKIDPYAVSIVPLSEPTDILITMEYKVPPTFIPPKPIDTGIATIAGAPVSTNNQPRVAQRFNAQEYLASQGVDFPTGASANYLPQGSKLVVRNTRDNIDQIDALVDAAMSVSPSQVDISTKFLEINQNNVQELSFDWLLGPLSIGNGGTYGSGGGNSSNIGTDYPFSTAGMNPVGDVRSGTRAITGNSIDALLAGQTTSISSNPAPGIFSIAGIFSDPQFQLVIRALNQKKGIDLMAAPKVTTKSGVKATVKITEEFIYPKSYTPPTIPTTTGNNGGGTVIVDLTALIPPTITPAFPDNFTMEPLGVILTVTPTIAPDGYTINLDLDPKVEEFEGFINYGSPINTVAYTRSASSAGVILTPISRTLTTNTIDQPVFSIREVTTSVTVCDGSTVALGGLITEQVQKVQDKVPVLGDIPGAGRLFRSDADQKIKKNLVIFVTPTILDANGQPRRDSSEEPEIVTPIGLPADLPQPTVSSASLNSK
jgi:general secretion pathway protein D